MCAWVGSQDIGNLDVVEVVDREMRFIRVVSKDLWEFGRC